jgi:hypothetical protein
MSIWTGSWLSARKKELNYDWWTGASVKFGSMGKTAILDIKVLLPAAIFIGVVGGLMGPFFINVNTRVNMWRARVLKTKWLKVIETVLLCMITATFFYWPSYFMRPDSTNCPTYKIDP